MLNDQVHFMALCILTPAIPITVYWTLYCPCHFDHFIFIFYVIFSGVKASVFCGIYSMGMAPLQRSYLWYKSKNL